VETKRNSEPIEKGQEVNFYKAGTLKLHPSPHLMNKKNSTV